MTELKSEKRKIYKKLLKRFIVVSFFIIALGGYGVYWVFFDMSRLPTGEFLTEETSPVKSICHKWWSHNFICNKR